MTQVPVHGNLSHAMRDNYAEHGVDEYYRKVSATYRNPFFPGIKKVVWTFMTRWWHAEGRAMYGEAPGGLRVLDMAAGSGEATICLLDWEKAGHEESPGGPAGPSTEPDTVTPVHPVPSSQTRGPFIPPNARRSTQSKTLFDMGPPELPHTFDLKIVATDPYTAPAYEARTSRLCHALSFTDLANTQLPDGAVPDETGVVFDLIICSFALHILTDPSELFALLYELSTKARWLAIVAPHKKPEIKEGWGWERWDMKNWQRAGESLYSGKRGKGEDDADVETELEIVRDKVKLRLYRSINVDHPTP